MKQLWVSLCVVCVSACGDVSTAETYVPSNIANASAGSVDTIGATPGGAQDIGYARALIDGGQVPRPGAITIEGLLSEHDLATTGPPCSSALCVRPAMAAVTDAEGETSYFIQLGMTTGVDVADFRRPPVDLVVLIDHSSAMSGDMAQTNTAVTRLLGQLRDDDRVAVLAFADEVTEIHPMSSIDDLATLQRKVERIEATGGNNLDLGLMRAFDTAREAGSDPARMRRVVLLSCGYPASGAGTAYSEQVEAAAASGIGLTFVGVLLGFDYQLANSLSQARGGNYFYTGTLDAIERVFDEELDYVLTPVAYDLDLGVKVGAGYSLERVWGLPGDVVGEPEAHLEVSTAFFSNRRGALLLELRKNESSDGEEGSVEEAAPIVGNVSLAYEANPALGLSSEPESARTLSAPRLDESGAFYESDGARKTVALVRIGDAIREACELYPTQVDAAIDVLDAAIVDATAQAEALDDDGLRTEIELIQKLADNMR